MEPHQPWLESNFYNTLIISWLSSKIKFMLLKGQTLPPSTFFTTASFLPYSSATQVVWSFWLIPYAFSYSVPLLLLNIECPFHPSLLNSFLFLLHHSAQESVLPGNCTAPCLSLHAPPRIDLFFNIPVFAAGLWIAPETEDSTYVLLFFCSRCLAKGLEHNMWQLNEQRSTLTDLADRTPSPICLCVHFES